MVPEACGNVFAVISRCDLKTFVMRPLDLRSLLFSKKLRFISSKSRPPWQEAVDVGLYDQNNPDYYRSEINLVLASKILSTPNLFWDAFLHDLSQQATPETEIEATIKQIRTLARTFIAQGEVVDRQEVKSTLEDITANNLTGQLVLYLGGMILDF